MDRFIEKLTITIVSPRFSRTKSLLVKFSRNFSTFLLLSLNSKRKGEERWSETRFQFAYSSSKWTPHLDKERSFNSNSSWWGEWISKRYSPTPGGREGIDLPLSFLLRRHTSSSQCHFFTWQRTLSTSSHSFFLHIDRYKWIMRDTYQQCVACLI